MTKSIFDIPSAAAEEDHIDTDAAAACFFPADVGEWLLSLAGRKMLGRSSKMSGAAGRESALFINRMPAGRSWMALHEFEAQLVTLLPKMRIWALALTHNRSAADDLVQEAAVKALAACDSFLVGTNFGAWIRRILLNSFITGMRSRRFIADVGVPDQAVVPDYIDRIALCELALAMDLLPREQKAALISIAVDERSYAELAQESGCAIGTLKSRVHRARLQLRSHMGGGRRLVAA